MFAGLVRSATRSHIDSFTLANLFATLGSLGSGPQRVAPRAIWLRRSMQTVADRPFSRASFGFGDRTHGNISHASNQD